MPVLDILNQILLKVIKTLVNRAAVAELVKASYNHCRFNLLLEVQGLKPAASYEYSQIMMVKIKSMQYFYTAYNHKPQYFEKRI